jgi:hypothetical protein
MPDNNGNAIRIQRSRKRGYRTPEGVIYVGRPTMFGNPFQVARFGHKAAVLMHREWLRSKLGALFLERRGFDPGEIEAIYRLRARVMSSLHFIDGRDLACWCPLSSPCHADTLIEIARGYAEIERFAA